MAKVLGESGRYASQEEIKKFRQHYLVIIGAIAILGAVLGYSSVFLSSSSQAYLPFYNFSCLGSILLCIIYLVDRIGFQKLEEIEKRRVSMRKGAAGEKMPLPNILRDFPENYCVINGLITPFGDLDHVVIGPTGVYISTPKTGRELFPRTAKASLLLNGKPTDKPTVKPFVTRMMNVKDKIKTLCNLDPFFKAVLVFPIARVDARWGKTGSANCIRDDQLWSYIVENEFAISSTKSD